MRRYRVSRREPLVEFILSALRTCGAEILSPPNSRSAPFEIGIRTPAGRQLDLICYAFFANKYRQRGRPKDEHRFQVKYGSEFKKYHRLFIAREPNRITLMFGAHLEEDLFIAVDPSMHEWTRFSKSVELKTGDLLLAKEFGWHGWERDRSNGRRILTMPFEDVRTEGLLAFTPSHFLRYVLFEEIATGIDPGERLLLAEQLSDRTLSAHVPSESPPPVSPYSPRTPHPLEVELGLPANTILDMIGSAFRLKVAVRGRAAEQHLEEQLRTAAGVSRVTPLDRDGWPDFEVRFRRRRPIRIECKNVLRKTTTKGDPRVDFQKTRASKNKPCSRFYKSSQFEVLAACLHPVTTRWEYHFSDTASLPDHPQCPGHITARIVVEGPSWTPDLSGLLDRLTR